MVLLSLPNLFDTNNFLRFPAAKSSSLSGVANREMRELTEFSGIEN